MKTLELEKVAPAVRRAARLARRDVLVLTENGKPAFAIVGVKDAMALEALSLGRNSELMEYLDEVSARTRAGRRYSLAEIRKELGLHDTKPARVRSPRRR